LGPGTWKSSSSPRARAFLNPDSHRLFACQGAALGPVISSPSARPPVIATAPRSTLVFILLLLRCQQDNTNLTISRVGHETADHDCHRRPQTGLRRRIHFIGPSASDLPINTPCTDSIRTGWDSRALLRGVFLHPLPAVSSFAASGPPLLACLAAPSLFLSPLRPCCRGLGPLPSESSHPLAISLPLPATHVCSSHPPSTLIEPITAVIKSPSRTPSEKAHRIDNDDPKQRPLNRLHSKLLPAGSQFDPLYRIWKPRKPARNTANPSRLQTPTSSPPEPYHRREKLHHSIYWPESQ
jgi:hypothetical protein